MAALLLPTYTEEVLWQVQAPPAAVPAEPLPDRADVVVVGAGYAGLSAARELARRGREVIVLDKEPLGWRASTRNGGMVIPELKAGPGALEKKLGALGPRLYHEVNDAFDALERLVVDEGIDCDYRRSGQLYLAHAKRLVPKLAAMAREHGDELGEPVRFVPREELADEIGSGAYHAGVVLERTGGLHPAKFHDGLARLALDAGARVQERTPATRLGRRGDRFRVATPRGEIECRHVVVTTNAYADGLLPELRRRVLPVGSFVIATEVLDAATAHSVNPRGRMFVDTKNFLFYWRLTPDRRLLFGGRRSLGPTTVPEARDFLYDSMLAVHPQLAGTRVEYAWGGNVAITLDRLPHVGVVDGAWYATGCNGSGVALNSWLGTRLALTIAGDTPPPAFAELTHRPIPFYHLRRAYLPVVGQWFRWGDRGFSARISPPPGSRRTR